MTLWTSHGPMHNGRSLACQRFIVSCRPCGKVLYDFGGSLKEDSIPPRSGDTYERFRNTSPLTLSVSLLGKGEVYFILPT